MSIASIAKRSGLSRGYLEQLSLALTTARLLRSVHGRRGGYCLARPAAEITIGNIIEATIGAVSIVHCLDDPQVCLRSETCECRMVYTLINHRISEVLNAYTLADLLDPRWRRTMASRLDASAKSPDAQGAPAGESVKGKGRLRDAH